MQRWPIVLAVMATLLLAISGCAGGARASSWTGLTAVGGRLYAADLEQARALDATNGETMWTFPSNPDENSQGLFYATPAVADGRVFVASQIRTGGFLSQRQDVVWALDAETGNELWRFEGASGQYVEGGAVSEGIFVIGNGDGNVYGLDAETGTLKWTFETGHRVWATPLIVSDTVYIGSMDRHLYALRLSDGQVKWDFHTDGAFAGTPAWRDGTLYIGAFDDRFYAIDAQTGSERWRFQGEDWFWGSPAVYSDTVYATDVRGDVYALNAQTGEQVWHQELVGEQEQDAPVRAGPTLTKDGSKAFVAAENGTLYALDTVDGFAVWSKPNDGRGLSTPVVGDSVVYQSLIYGAHRIRALDANTGREIWAYPPVEEE